MISMCLSCLLAAFIATAVIAACVAQEGLVQPDLRYSSANFALDRSAAPLLGCTLLFDFRYFGGDKFRSLMGSLTWSTYRGDLFLIEEIFSNDVVDGERKGFAIADAYLLDDTEAFTSAAFDGCHKVPGSYCRVSSGTNALRPGISLALNKLAFSFRRSGTDGYTKLAVNVSAAKQDQKKFSDFSACMESNLDKLLK